MLLELLLASSFDVPAGLHELMLQPPVFGELGDVPEIMQIQSLTLVDSSNP